MFTGIVTDIGTIAALKQEGDLRARIRCGYDTSRIDMGASIATQPASSDAEGGVAARMGKTRHRRSSGRSRSMSGVPDRMS